MKRSALALALASAFAAHAQISADTVAGRNLGTIVTPGPGTWGITGGTTVGGTNLFHSFSQFSVPSGNTATFSGAAGLSNIVARVTGGSRSDIYGTLASTIAGANLWFINPAGIAFGPNAQLNVQGSFHASTASYIKFGASGQFGMSGAPAGTLTVNPTAFGFLGTPAPITLDRSVLNNPNGTISLVGGDIIATGTPAARVRIEAPGKRVNLGSSGAGEAVFAASGALESVAPCSPQCSISLTNTIVRTETGGAPGPISIRGGKLTLASSFVSTRSTSAAPGADIDVGLSGDFSMTGGFLRSTAFGGGDAGNVTLRAANVTLAGGAVIESSAVDPATFAGSGRAGRITIEATGDVLLTGASALSNSTFGTGLAGDTSISARSLAIRDQSLISASTYGDGDAGRVRIAVEDLTLSTGGRIVANTDYNPLTVPGSGAGGNIQIDASKTVDISGAGSGIFSETTNFGTGGSITVNAQEIRIHDSGRISSASVDPFTFGTGDAGSIQLAAKGSIRLESGGSITTQAQTSGGGQINIRAADTLSLDNSRIATSVADGSGNGGNIFIDPIFVVLNNSQIFAKAFAGNGGDITIITSYLIVSPPNSINESINASSERGISGRIVISSPKDDAGARLGALSSAYVDASALLRAACAARAGRPSSSFVGVGRGGLPASPDSAAYASYGSGGSSAAAWHGMAIRAASCPAAQIG